MITCLYCGNDNKDKALYCGMCGKALVLRHDKKKHHEPFMLMSLFKPPNRLDDKLRRCAARARSFLMTLATLAVLPLGLLAAGWAGYLAPDTGQPGSLVLGLLCPGAIVYGCIVYGYLMAKTGESCGAPFTFHFIMGCIPALVPAQWARLAGRSFVWPYVYLVLDAAIIAGWIWIFQSWPLMLMLMLFTMVPLIIYHLFGCSTREFAGALGLPPVSFTLWLCLLPDLLLGMLLWDYLGTLNPMDTRHSLSLTVMEIKLFLSLDDWLEYSPFNIAAFVYLLVTLAGWIKVVHDNLRIPAA